MAAARGLRQQPPRRTAAAIKLSSITRTLIWLLRELGHSFLARAVEANLPIDMLKSNGSGVQMAQNHSQMCFRTSSHASSWERVVIHHSSGEPGANKHSNSISD
jgi:hypothetical protein